MYKKDLVNFLFLISFSMYGIGNYISATTSPSIGRLVSATPFVLIVLFYLLDVLYKKRFGIRLRKDIYILMITFLFSSIISIFVSLHKGFPNASLYVAISRSIILLVPFHAFIIFLWYNRNSSSDTFVRLSLMGLSFLLLVNLIGYAAGLTNQGHHLEGRLNLPFLGGLYSASSLMIFINLLIVRKIGRNLAAPSRWWWMIGYLMCNLVMIYLINSRLTMLLFLLVLGLMAANIVKSRLIYWVSLATIPIVLSVRVLLYEIVSLPVFAGIMQRVDFDDVTSFNGRAYLWEIGMNWLTSDRRGLLFGNGEGGQYFLDLLSFYGRLWSAGKTDLMHFHSSSLEYVVNQGLFGYLIFVFLLFKLYTYYRAKYILEDPVGDFLPGIVFLLFLLQIDTFVYLNGLGFLIFALLLAKVCVKQQVIPKKVEESEDAGILTVVT